MRIGFSITRFLIVVFVSSFVLRQARAETQGPSETEASHAVDDDCYNAIKTSLELGSGKWTPAVRQAYSNWAENVVLKELRQENQTVPETFLVEVRADSDLHDAMFGVVYPPDPSILQNYSHLSAAMGAEFMSKYHSLAIAVAVAKRIKGVEVEQDSDGSGTTKDFGRNYQTELWIDKGERGAQTSLKAIKNGDEKKFVDCIADFMKDNQVAASELYKSPDLQRQLIALLTQHQVLPSLIGQVKESVPFGEWLKNVMVVLGQRPATRENIPDTATWLRYLVSIYEATPSSTPVVGGKPLAWPLFPIDKAPWPLLMPLARPVPLGEAKYVWETFQGQHGSDRYHTYGPYRDDTEAMPYELQPSTWFWDAWPDRIAHGGECVPISKGTVDFYSCMAKPAVWAGQPGHANLLSFQFKDGAWTAQVEQAFAGGPNVTFAQWYFDEDHGAELRFRNLFDWAGAEHHLGLALAMNSGLESYMDTRFAANIYRILPAEKKHRSSPLLRSVLESNPYNPEIWYRLAEQLPNATEGMALAQATTQYPDPIGYFQVVKECVTRFAVLNCPPPDRESDFQSVYAFISAIPGIKGEEMESYFAKYPKTQDVTAQAAALEYDQAQADAGDVFGQLRLGERYRDGDGVPADAAAATTLFMKAAARGDKLASYDLEKMNPSVPAKEIAVTASSVFSSMQKEQHLVDGSGMKGFVHDNNHDAGTMWQSAKKPEPKAPESGLAPSPAWVRFDFAKAKNFAEILIWNHNQPNLANRGFRKTRIYGSSDGVSWFSLIATDTIELPQASGVAVVEPTIIVNASADRLVKAVIIAADTTDGNYGGDSYGLSAVRFIVRPAGPKESLDAPVTGRNSS